MTNLPTYIQKATDLGLLTVEDGKVTSCNKDAVETVLGTARIIEKLQPTTTAWNCTVAHGRGCKHMLQAGRTFLTRCTIMKPPQQA